MLFTNSGALLVTDFGALLFSDHTMLVDELIIDLLSKKSNCSKVLDFGAGSGTLSRLISDRFKLPVIAYEPMTEMMSVFHTLTPKSKYPEIYSVDTEGKILELSEHLNTIICVNVFDHILDIATTVKFFNSVLPSGGHLILCIPHPLKNIGNWVKEKRNGIWEYLYYQLYDYLEEGEIKRNREDIDGNLIIEGVVSQHRTISTYYNYIHHGGFEVIKMYEPKPDESKKYEFPMLYTQAFRIPYFWILDCVKKMTV
ncbi:MAG: methyltransferase domain-containing protein [Ferruginibacter sp.]